MVPKSLPKDSQMGVRDARRVSNDARRLPEGPRRTALEWYMVCVVVVAAVAVAKGCHRTCKTNMEPKMHLNTTLASSGF